MLPRPPTSTLFPYTTLFRSILFFRSICLTKAPIFHPSILCSCYVQQSHALYFYNNWDADYETTPTKAIWLLLIWLATTKPVYLSLNYWALFFERKAQANLGKGIFSCPITATST